MKKWKKIYDKAVRRIRQDIGEYWIIGIMILIYGGVTHVLFHQFCPFLILTGIPCAGCGMTRAFIQLFTGHFESALQYHAGVVIWAAAIAYAAIRRYVTDGKGKELGVIFGIAGSFSLVYYLYRMMTFPTGIQPMVYFEGNIFRQIVPFYDQILEKMFCI